MLEKLLIVVCLIVGVQKSIGLICIKCSNAATHDECDSSATLQRCNGADQACKTEIRFVSTRGRQLISKSCKQRGACLNNQRSNTCGAAIPNTWCYCCCDGDECNRGDGSCYPEREDQAESDQPRDPSIGQCFPPLSSLSFGSVRCTDGDSPGSRCTYACNSGYTMNEGSRTAVCEKDGLWSSAPPTCRTIKCFPNYNRLAHAFVYCTRSNNIRSLCRFFCRRGYTRIGTSRAACSLDDSNQSRGKWSNPMPRCVNLANPARCQILNAPENARVQCTSTTLVGSVCTFNCHTGYVMRGLSQATCEEDRFGRTMWSPGSPTCEAIPKCPPISEESIVNRNCDDGNNVGSSCTFECPPAFDLIGQSTVTCENVGEIPTWNAELPTCRESSCSNVNDVTNGIVSCTAGNNLGSVCSFVCHHSYHLIGRDQVTCGEHDIGAVFWDFESPRCQPMCSEITELQNGFVECIQGRLPGAACSFNCPDKYDLIGSYLTTCVEKDGGASWDNAVPTCKITCQSISEMPNRVAQCSDDNFFGSTCTFSCLAGYDLIGSTTVDCQEDDTGNVTWTNSVPICRKTCQQLPTISNGFMECSFSNLVGSSCTFSCAENYVLNSQMPTNCSETADGTTYWTHGIPNCEKKCASLATIDNGVVECSDGNRAGSTCTFTCADNYASRSPTIAVCNEIDDDSTGWSNPVPTCEKLCPPLNIENGFVQCDQGRHIGTNCSFKCNDFHALERPSYTSCVANVDNTVSWTGSIPTCHRSCLPAPIVSNGVADCSNGNYPDSICTYTCNPYHTMLNPADVECILYEDGETAWSGTPPVCQKRCSALPQIQNGNTHCTTGNAPGSICVFSCFPDYTLDDTRLISCVHNNVGPATWTRSVPKCERTCQAITSVANGLVLCTKGNRMGSVCNFSCFENFYLVNSQSMVCVESQDGLAAEWTGVMPTCAPITCPSLPPIARGNWSCPDEVVVGSVCSYTCGQGFTLLPSLSTQTTCRIDSTWDKMPPCCAMPCPDNPHIDILFALDSSSSVGSSSWAIMIQFVQNIIRMYDVTGNNTWVGAFRYNSEVDKDHLIPFNYGDIHGKQRLIDSIAEIPYDGSGTKTGKALEHAANVMFQPDQGDRPLANDVLIVLTDGRSQDDVEVGANMLREHGVLTYAIAVKTEGGRLDYDQLRTIAGHEHNLQVLDDGFSSLTDDFAREMAMSVCHDPCHDWPYDPNE